MIMKNGKEFDYDKNKPNLDKNDSKKLTEMRKEKSENLFIIWYIENFQKGKNLKNLIKNSNMK